MELEQKYIEDEYEFEFDEFFFKQMHHFEPGVKISIADKIDGLYGMEETGPLIESIAGYVTNSKSVDVFFVLDYHRENKSSPIVLIDIEEINLDSYLDYININRYIK